MRPRLTLARQFLVLQLVIVLLVVGAVTGVSLAQANIAFRDTEGRRLLSVAETVAAMDAVRVGLSQPGARGGLPGVAESARGVSGASYVVIVDRLQILRTGPDIDRHLDIGDSVVLKGRAWVGELAGDLVAHAPVFNDARATVGFVAVGRGYPTVLDRLATALPNLLTHLVLACLLGVGGSLLLARRIGRQTLGMHPAEIIGLAEHREAMLHGIKEGVVAIDPAGRVTLANDEAVRLLDLPSNVVGMPLATLGLSRRLRSTLSGASSGHDEVVLHRDRVLVLNRTPLTLRGTPIGAVTTLRDRTELVAMQHELDVTRYATDALHAQARAFATRLQAIAELLQRGRIEDAGRYAGQASQAYERLSREVAATVADPGVAALLVAKASLAAAYGVDFRLAPPTDLPCLDGALSVDVVTILAALLDDALAAVGDAGAGWIVVTAQFGANAVHLAVQDSGHREGEPPARAQVSHRGASGSGVFDGLATARAVCSRRGGEMGYGPGQGRHVEAWVPAGAGAL
ncbi:MAG TPA: PAS domain-containing protein [Pilimelia sp.]|nr:PAS domain-containing protein [Pilimelia sp.]